MSSDVAADWHRQMIPCPWCIIQSSIALNNEWFDSWCSMQTYHHPYQPHLECVYKLLLIFHPAEIRRLSCLCIFSLM